MPASKKVGDMEQHWKRPPPVLSQRSLQGAADMIRYLLEWLVYRQRNEEGLEL
jgi:hypothetical protein